MSCHALLDLAARDARPYGLLSGDVEAAAADSHADCEDGHVGFNVAEEATGVTTEKMLDAKQ